MFIQVDNGDYININQISRFSVGDDCIIAKLISDSNNYLISDDDSQKELFKNISRFDNKKATKKNNPNMPSNP